jgi:hypothetical protein
MKPLADIGNPAAPVGSAEWCKYIHGIMCQTKRRANSEVSSLKYTLIEFRKSKHWERLTDADGHSFRAWEDYVQYPEPDGLGMVVADAEAIISEKNDKRLIADIEAKDRRNQKPVGTNQYSEGVDNENGDINTRPTGTSRAQALRRLRKAAETDARIAAIRDCVLAGRISPHTGMIEAGFRKKAIRKKRTGLDQLRKAWAKATSEERSAFLSEIPI